jgi:hypothetical protein
MMLGEEERKEEGVVVVVPAAVVLENQMRTDVDAIPSMLNYWVVETTDWIHQE